uniref:Helicase ATP-binding domain-containing protein n=1 Tax=Daucus carota subsp. sativus TaxID=79200 RepID=A0A166A5D5_DAUCS
MGASEQDVSEYRKSLAIRVSGFDVPRHVKTFEDCGFSVEIMKAISGQAYEKTASIQCQDFPVVLSERDIIGIAKTGSVYGGMSKLEQFKELKAGGEIVVATPGRLIDLLKMKALTMSRATYLVLDEADRMFDLGFEPQIRSKCDARKGGGKRAKGRGGGDNRGVRGVDFGLGIGYNAESKRSPSHVVPGRSAAVNSLKTGMTTQFKSSFVAALSGTLNARLSNSSGMQAGNRVLRGFVSGGSGR